MTAAAHKRLARTDLMLLAAGVIGFALYLFLLPAQHPDAAAHYTLGSEGAQEAATTYLSTNGYAVDGLAVEASLHRHQKVLSWLQATQGHRAARRLLASGAVASVPGYYWRVRFQEADQEQRLYYRVDVNLDGDVWRFEQGRATWQAGQRQPLRRINRDALVTALGQNDIEAAIDLSALPDSAFVRSLSFALGAPSADTTSNDTTAAAAAAGFSTATMLARLREGAPVAIGRVQTAALARHHLAALNIPTDPFQVDSVWVLPERDNRQAVVRFVATSGLYHQHAKADVHVSSLGALQRLWVDFQPSETPAGGGTFNDIADVMMGALYILLGIILVVSFFRRLAARLIDARGALVDALVLGGMFGIWVALGKWEEVDIGFDALWAEVVGRLFLMSVLGAILGVLVFLFSSTTDSFTRAVWSKKLFTVGLMRQGAFRNTLVGAALLRGVGLAFLILGLTVLLLAIFPGAGLALEERFMPDRSWQPMVSQTFWAGWLSYIVSILALLAVGTYLYSWKERAWIVVVGIAVTVMLLQGAPIELEPAWYTWGFSAVVGGVLGLAFWHYDVVACFIGLFVAHMVSGLSEGWLVAGSPLWVDTLLGGLMLVSILGLGFVGVLSGRSGRDVDEYVPGYIKNLTHEERLRSELEIAHQVQASFLPRTMPQIDGLDLAGMCLPALEVGGDYYDFVEVGPGRLAIVVGDVSGKGIPAAFYMTLTKGFLRTLCRDVESPAEVLRRLNTLFCENVTAGTFVSMIYGVLDVPARTFTFARAGHNPVILKRSPSQEADLVQPAGMAIGLTRGPRFDDTIEEVRINLRVGDVLVFYTDGFSEAMNRMREQYGDEQLARKVAHVGQRTANSILRTVTEDVHHFIEGVGRLDDMTMVVAKLAPRTNHRPDPKQHHTATVPPAQA